MEIVNLFDYILKEKIDVLVCKKESQSIPKSTLNGIFAFLKPRKALKTSF